MFTLEKLSLGLKRNADVTCCIFNNYVSQFAYRAATWPLAELPQPLLQAYLLSHDAMVEMTLDHFAVMPACVCLSVASDVEHKCSNRGVYFMILVYLTHS